MPSTGSPPKDAGTTRQGGGSTLVHGIALGLATAALNVAVVLALYDRYGYPVADGAGLAVFVATLVAFAFVPGFVSGHTRLVVPGLGFLALLAGVAVAEVSTPGPEWGQLGEYTVVHGPTFVNAWANHQSIFVALLLVGAVAEFGLRSAYGLADGGLRNLPALPFSRYVIAWVAGGFGALFGVAVALLAVSRGANPTGIELVIFACATLVAAVPLAALLYRGLVSPLVLFVLVVPRPLFREVFVGTDSPVFLLLLGPFGAVFGVVGAIEYYVRARRRDGSDGAGLGTEGGS